MTKSLLNFVRTYHKLESRKRAVQIVLDKLGPGDKSVGLKEIMNAFGDEIARLEDLIRETEVVLNAVGSVVRFSSAVTKDELKEFDRVSEEIEREVKAFLGENNA